MNRRDLEELHYITAISNVPSIMSLGVLSHNQAKNLSHDSGAMEEIQNRRKNNPRGLLLHDYVNLYIYARNPMLYVLRSNHERLCVLRISTEILDMDGVVITDSNASSDYVRFASAPGGLVIVDKEMTFAEYWTHEDPIETYRRKAAKCAEVLVPNRLAPNYIQGAFVSCQEAKAAFEITGAKIPITQNPSLFFR